MVTAETAVVLPVIVVLLAAMIGVISAVAAKISCTDAAREGARAAARGDSTSDVVASARRLAPPGAQIEVSLSESEATVVVSMQIRPLGRLSGAIEIRSAATSRREPTPVDAQPSPTGSDP
ncbi:MAG: TadE family type IV pilus minor pilin [Antricoccus sp.]